MAIVGDHPTSGVRFVLERSEVPAPLRYQGELFTPDTRYTVQVDVSAEGTATAEGSAPPPLLERARLLVKTMVKKARSEGVDPPRRIQRWRGETAGET